MSPPTSHECSACGGMGWFDSPMLCVYRCPVCLGSGRVDVSREERSVFRANRAMTAGEFFRAVPALRGEA